MARWDPDARGRLERAAIELFAQQGFTETTVPQIAERAGVTTRTFFRHYADKREVLFASEGELATLFAELIDEAPAELSAMPTLERAARGAAELAFEPRREQLREWRDIVSGEPALQERGLSKQQLVVTTAVRALGERGVDAATAELAAGIVFVAFQCAVAEWATETAVARPLTRHLEEWFSRMHQVTADTSETMQTP